MVCKFIDNTCPTKKSRTQFISLAKEFNYKCVCFEFKIEKNLAEHLNQFRTVDLFTLVNSTYCTYLI